jgi:hypothetical protein
MTEPEYPKWKHRKGDTYRYIEKSIMGNPTSGYGSQSYISLREHSTLAGAVREGFQDHDRGDDFNVGVWRTSQLVAITWMGEVVDDDPDVLAGVLAGYQHWTDA